MVGITGDRGVETNLPPAGGALGNNSGFTLASGVVVAQVIAPDAGVEAARQVLERAFGLPSVSPPPPPPAGLGARATQMLGNFARLGLAFVAGRYLTSEGDLNLAKDLGQIGRSVTLRDWQDAQQATRAMGWDAEGMGRDWTPDQRTRFVHGAADLYRLLEDGTIGEDTFSRSMNTLFQRVANMGASGGGELLGPPAPAGRAEAPPTVSYTPPVAIPQAPPEPTVNGSARLTLGGSAYTIENTSEGFRVTNADYGFQAQIRASSLDQARDILKSAWLAGQIPGPTPSESPLTIANQRFSIVGNNGTYGLRDPAGELIYQLPGRTLAEAAEAARAAYLGGDIPGFPPQSNPLTIGGHRLDIVGSHGDFGLLLPNGDYAGRVRAGSLSDAVAQIETLYLDGRIPGLPPNRLTIGLEPGLEVRIMGPGGSGPYGLVGPDGELLLRLRAPGAHGGDRHPFSFDEAASIARDLFARGALAPFGLEPSAPDATYPPIPDPWETDPEPAPAPTTTPAPDPAPAPPPVSSQPLLPPAVPPDAPLLPPAGETGGGDGTNGPGGPPRTGGPDGTNNDDEEPTPEELNAFQQWLRKSAENWNALRGNAIERAQQFRQLLSTTISTVGKALAITNGLGAAGGALFYGGIQEQRTGPAVTPANAADELAKLQADPLAYLEANYTNAVAGINLGDRLYNMSGNLLELTNPDGTIEHFRRVPEDLFLALRDAQQAAGNPSSQVFVQEQYTRPDGTVDTLDVEIRPPFRSEPLRDATIYGQLADNSQPWSFAFRAGLSFGPPEGQNLTLGLNTNFFYRTQTDTITTVRLGLQPPGGTGAQLGLRQQNTNVLTGISANASAIDINPSQVRDLTDPDSPFNDARLVVANARLYLVTGNRDRVRIDATAPTAGSSPTGGYARARETGFLEIGLGGDFLRYTQGDTWWSANFYNELQLYTPDLRTQLGFGQNGGLGGGLQPFPLFEVDPALQFSTNQVPRITPAVPGLTGDDVNWDNPAIYEPFHP
ncbi:hypothetical protein [Salinarimonas chemoclinalis]|uniref:hypothetical protein n=1 Tax=Salinarimonas chemoclinalis TaxID=3241599 RepID=UPI003557350C